MGLQEGSPPCLELIPGLPDDLAVQCLLRVSRLHHGLLRCVCRRWCSLLSMPTFFDLRIQHKLAQEWLYVMLRTSNGEYKWFSFVEDTHLWLPLPPLPQNTIGAACTVAGGKLYMIGGSQGERSSRSVWAFDPRFNSWRTVASMKVAREFAAAGVIAGQIYVLGGCLPGSSVRTSANWAEVYDPRSDEWSSIPSPPEKRYKWMHGNAVLHNKLFAVADMGGIIFDPFHSTWDCISDKLDAGWRGRAAVIDDILFSCNNAGKLFGYDCQEDMWLEVQGWEKDVPKLVSCAMLTNVGGKLYVLWEIPQSGWETKFALAALAVSKGPRLLTGKVLWYHVISCSMLIGATIHSISIAL
ncbi:hypothetical protein GOP47_0010992 [Adiantum capillus-veneris]|uniref:F-box domain-containing protein n=1 Tax=Adiantum capillus-veneris TaxID=13818 RepID=A0A9D4UW56_ADICA|nr:hypothetical protein GOP47_0010992 [Adiantum capillus-veneris]